MFHGFPFPSRDRGFSFDSSEQHLAPAEGTAYDASTETVPRLLLAGARLFFLQDGAWKHLHNKPQSLAQPQASSRLLPTGNQFVRYWGGANMKLLRVAFGLIAVIVAILLAVSAAATFDRSQGGAIFLAILAVVFAAVGRKWLKGRTPDSWRAGPATEKQKSFADDLGIRYPKNITKGDLSDLIEEAK